MSARVTFDGAGYARLEFSYHPWIVAQLKERIHINDRAYDPSTKRWTVAPSWSSVAIGILRDVFGDEVEVDYTRGTSAEPTPIRSTDAAYRTLHLTNTAPPELVAAAYRTLSKLSHPDLGGNTIAQQSINTAFEQLKARGAA